MQGTGEMAAGTGSGTGTGTGAEPTVGGSSFRTRKRTHTCGELRAANAGETVRLAGWVDRRRDHGGLVFADLRDRYGKTQIVFSPQELGAEGFARADALRPEYVVKVEGLVAPRPADARNPNLATGEVEVRVRSLDVLNKATTPPFEVSAGAEGDEVALEQRFRYRYVDLRRPIMQQRLLFRHKVILEIRRYLDSIGFAEIETPILTKSTPEGARDYLVPSRVHKGMFYALPQSPQIFKQLLMVAGYDRYYQVARCFRDEDLRADRQPEFTQLDLEMSFVEEEDIYALWEGLMAHVWRTCLPAKTLGTPFRRMAYADALARFGIDKPDLRFGLEISDLSDVARRSTADFLKKALEGDKAKGKPGAVRGIRVSLREGAEKLTRKDLDALPNIVRDYGAKGVAWLRVEAGGALQGTLGKFFDEAARADLVRAFSGGDTPPRTPPGGGAEPGDLLLIVADANVDVVATSLGQLRNYHGRKLELVDRSRDEMLWVTDFPFFEYDAKEGTYIACRHPFTRPRDADIPELERAPLQVKTCAYDLVLNGSELGSGSIRNHDPELQERVFAILGYSKEESQRRFGFLLEARRSGAPPHGGAAIGLDRFTAIIQGVEMREVIPFMKTAKAVDLMTEAPSPADPAQLRMLGIQVIAEAPGK